MTRRLFVAITLPDGVRETLAAYSRPFGTWAGARITKTENLHITLRFLGDVDDRDIPDLRSSLAGAAEEARAFALRFTWCEYAPPGDGPHTMVWARYEDCREFLSAVRSVARATQAFVGKPGEEKPPIAHVTLARFGVPVAWDASPLPPLDLPELPVNGFALFASSAGDDGRTYEMIGAFPFGEGR